MYFQQGVLLAMENVPNLLKTLLWNLTSKESLLWKMCPIKNLFFQQGVFDGASEGEELADLLQVRKEDQIIID